MIRLFPPDLITQEALTNTANAKLKSQDQTKPSMLTPDTSTKTLFIIIQEPTRFTIQLIYTIHTIHTHTQKSEHTRAHARAALIHTYRVSHRNVGQLIVS